MLENERPTSEARPRITQVDTLHSGFLRLLKLTIAQPDTSGFVREVEDHGDAVAVLPYDPASRQALLARQFRAPALHAAGLADLLEAPAGMLDEDDAEACARREAMEEIGLRLGPLERVGTFFSSPGVSTERHHLFLAPFSQADRVGEGGGLAEESEEITIVPVDLAELAASADAGELVDLKTFTLVQALRLRHPDLFSAEA
ncbi:NUDIX domain-containing protein [Microvirga massiliensis]|uniref:NUDIX domain-containing protein n=1 Tax=Microvirga massiliensis TaxID=1033741 RepID=UPI00062B9261|nr:NUDIX hydrolase [Microvirga massiliensis]